SAARLPDQLLVKRPAELDGQKATATRWPGLGERRLSAVPRHEQEAFLSAHGDLYEDSHGAVRVSIKDGRIGIGSLDGPGFATGATPDLQAMRRCHYTP
ncbi:MAG: hypothetical protein AAGD34_19220, partial [Pseudomonadota bacterium]